eukprot:Protomagalhaensia_wolfi_Nauph_80__5759@NODE_701_length_2092_cov_17_986849_g524_i0_p1_GENE_NODE_701_length_2092_cov_17_986849_g524_i0NODE_701_length_2092_cov_17_986849_g524_i0_p1_ORF_typecomplete_len404_score100_31ANAPC3/PF12895_7/9_5e09ANAPC3/PF12895_7/3_5e08ANAPC3/PF12895_7/7_5e06RelA_SpoT/PF04607_17/1_3e16RelA_SpoT/PF04607_17/3_2e03TPR_9/PF13371_6/0_0079TPR_9/PF13371_6/1_6e09TPR_19/PF14559_6/1_2TPR_19/PF14559_6/2_6e08TPR_15/PF13429_6/1_8e10TPR_15/PF13429_6/0_035TPR_2/PF07719_17/3_6e02TPR_2/PF0
MTDVGLTEVKDRAAMEALYNECVPLFKRSLDLFQERLMEELKGFQINITFKHRIKKFDRYYKKLLQKGPHCIALMPITNDFMGLRLICPYLEDVVTIEEYLMTAYKVEEADRKREKYSFKEFGYDSTHFEIELPKDLCPQEIPNPPLLEIQVRTILQDAFAEAEHDSLYQNPWVVLEGPLHRKLSAVNATLALADMTFQELRNYHRKVEVQLKVQHEQVQQHIENLLHTGLTLPKGEKPNSEQLQKFETVESILFSALEAQNQGDGEKALKVYNNVIQNSRKPPRAVILLRAFLHLTSNRIHEALNDFKSANTVSEDHTSLYYLGVCNLINDDYNQALQYFNQSLNLKFTQPEALLGRARAYYKLDQFQKAHDDCQLCLSQNPNIEQAIALKSALDQQLTDMV